MDYIDITLLVVGGFMAGVINTVAGNGSAITLTVLMATGLDATVANATNRIGVFAQTLTAVLSLNKSNRTKKLTKDSVWFYWPTILGSIVGALLASDFDEEKLKMVIGFFMIILLITMLLKPKRWLINTDSSKKKKTPLNFIIFFVIVKNFGHNFCTKQPNLFRCNVLKATLLHVQVFIKNSTKLN